MVERFMVQNMAKNQSMMALASATFRELGAAAGSRVHTLLLTIIG